MKSNVVVSTIALLSASLAASPVLSAQSVGQQQLIANSKTQVAEHLASTNKTCGSNIKMNVDYASFSDVSTSPDNPNQQAPWAFIVNVTDALDSFCSSGPEAKTAVQTKLKMVTVMHAKTESETFSNGTLHYAVPYNGAGYSTITKFLMSNL